jgi:hypothetical protein
MFEKDLWCPWTQYGGDVAGDDDVADRGDVAVSRPSLLAPAAASPGVPSWLGRERCADGSIHLRVVAIERSQRLSRRVEEAASLGSGA